MTTERILVVAPQPFYEDRGTPIAVRHLLHALSQLGYAVDVLTLPMGRSPEIADVRYVRLANPLGIRVVPVGFSLRKLWFDLLLFIALRRQLKRTRYRCIHAVEEAAFLAVFAARRYRTPVLYDMQSSLAEQMAKRWWLRSRPAKALLRRCERWLIRRADCVVSSAGLAEYVRASIPEVHVTEWRYPSQYAAAHPVQTFDLRRQLRIGPDHPIVMYTGTFEPYQGLANLVAAIPMVLKRVPQAVFVLIGGEASQLDEAQRLMDGRLLRSAIRILGRQPSERIPQCLAAADVLVSPRTYGSNAPLKIFDYLAAGRPIVATAIAAHQVVLTDRLAVLTQPTPEALAVGILEVLTNPARAQALQAAVGSYTKSHLGWLAFIRLVEALYDDLLEGGSAVSALSSSRVSIVIPARNAGASIVEPIHAVLAQRRSDCELEVVVVDDGSTDDTAARARQAGASVIRIPVAESGNPAAARNRGAAQTTGDPVIFLDADCAPQPGWLEALLAAHARGAVCVGGSLELPPGLSATARWDYYCGWYHVHPRRRGGPVAHHPPCNVSVRRRVFSETGGFTEQQPIAYAHEELGWQAQVARMGHRLAFEPRAVAWHRNRSGFGNLLRRNYRWAYSAIESKSASGIARMPWLYRHPWLVVVASLPLSIGSAVYITGCWLRAGVVEPLLVFPVVLAARLAYAIGLMVGGVRWLRHRGASRRAAQPRWT